MTNIDDVGIVEEMRDRGNMILIKVKDTTNEFSESMFARRCRYRSSKG